MKPAKCSPINTSPLTMSATWCRLLAAQNSDPGEECRPVLRIRCHPWLARSHRSSHTCNRYASLPAPCRPGSLPAGTFELEELEADGFEALVRAVRDYDSSRGPLGRYVVVRCRGAMIDGLRRRMLTTRTQRANGVEEPVLQRLHKFRQSPEEQPLTARELTVLRFAAEGATSAETAKRLRKACETVKSQRRAIIAKLRARNIIHAVSIGYQRGLLY
jgi:DNA-binding CsgD family transcriptional regulator